MTNMTNKSEDPYGNLPEQAPPANLVSDHILHHARLVDWNCNLLESCLQQVVAARKNKRNPKSRTINPLEPKGDMVLDEVADIITLPHYDESQDHHVDPSTIQIPAVVKSQLKDFVTVIASCYRENAFHNFDHASQVCMSVHKLLSRIVAPDRVQFDMEQKSSRNAYELHGRPIHSEPVCFCPTEARSHMYLIFCA